jgi:ABC-type transport system involved in cytochrome c biogenesis permease subunit
MALISASGYIISYLKGPFIGQTKNGGTMNSSLILSITTFIASAFFYIMAWIFRKTVFGRIAFVVATIGLLGNLAGFGFRWAESYQLGFGRAPLSNLYESLVFFLRYQLPLCTSWL